MKTRLLRFLSKRTATIMFAFTMLLFGVFAWGMSENTVYAAEYTNWDATTNDDFAVAEYTADIAKTYVGTKAPTAEGYLFAGWFKDAKCTEEQVIKSAADVTGTCYAKFVPEDVLSIKVQITEGDANLATQTTEKNMRFVSSVDTETYLNVGFRMKYLDDSQNWVFKINKGTVVYKRITSSTAGDEFKFSPKVVDTKSEYFMTSVWKGDSNTGITEEDFDTNYYVRAFWVTFDGVRVYGPTRYVSVNDGINKNIVNMSVKDTAKAFEGKTLTASYTNSAGTAQSKTATLAYHDGTYAHLKVDMGTGVDRTSALLSATKFSISDGTNTIETIYRNLYTTHETSTTTANADSSWYSVYSAFDGEEDEFVIATSADLYGLEYLANYNGGGTKVTFANMTIYLVSDITVNKGTASVESGWTADSGAKTYDWYAARGFKGVLDGQKHVISGLRGTCTTDATSAHYTKGVGLFTETAGATIHDVSLVNSYYSTAAASQGTGAIVGRGNGTIYNVYTDVVIGDATTAVAGYSGGILGVSTGTVTVYNCWSDSDLTLSGAYNGGIVGNATGKTVSVEHCLNSGNITYVGTGNPFAGGIVGRGNGANTNLTINDCLNLGTVKSTGKETNMGSILGTAEATGVTITNTYTVDNYKQDGVTILPEVGLDNRTEQTGTTSLQYNTLCGLNAFANTDLSFEGYATEAYWAVREGNTPMLLYFLGETDKTLSVAGRSKTEFVMVDGVGYISNLEQLKSFRDQQNAGTLSFANGEKVVLTDNIEVNAGADAAAWAAGTATLPTKWTPINNFAGTFDGQKYAISGIYGTAVSGITGIGLFTNVNSGTIENLEVTNSYFVVNSNAGSGGVVGCGNGTFRTIHTDVIIEDSATTAYGYIGGIIGKANGAVVIEDCWSSSTISAQGNYVGGMIGECGAETVQVLHCLNTGNLTHGNTKTNAKTACFFGGLVGRVASTGTLTIEDSVNHGVIQSTGTGTTRIGAIIGYSNANTTATNVYGVKTYNEVGVSVGVTNGYTGTAIAVEMIEPDSIKGENCYYYTQLDLKSASKPNAYWAARSVNIPMLVSFLRPDDIVIDVTQDSATTLEIVNNKGYIYNADQLYDFAAQMEAGTLPVNSDTEIIVVNDIVANESFVAGDATSAKVWTPISGYPGIFNGQGNTISGIYATKGTGVSGVGLFTNTTETTVVENLKIEKSYFEAGDNNGTGAIVGKGSGTFRNIYVDATIVDDKSAASSVAGNLGGIVGQADGTVTIENCWSNSTITSQNRVYLGGIMGSANGQKVTIKHCLNTGVVTIETGCTATFGYAGGIIGKTGSGSATAGYTGTVTIEDCLGSGIVRSKSTATTAAIGGLVGYATGASSTGAETVTIKNSYSAINRNADTNKVQGAATAVGVDERSVTTHGVAKETSELLGNLAYMNTNLDFRSTDNTTGYWICIENGTPILGDYLSADDVIADVSGMSKDEFTLVDNVGYIWNRAQLDSFAAKMQDSTFAATVNSKTVVYLMDNITYNSGDRDTWVAGTATPTRVWTPIEGYPGTFEGQGFTIGGLYGKTVSGVAGYGLFTKTADTTVVRDLSVVNSYYIATTNAGTGGLVGQGSGKFTNILTDVVIKDTASNVAGSFGGVIGCASGNIRIENCYSKCTLSTYGQYAGGILGNTTNAAGAYDIYIVNCLNSGYITYEGTTEQNLFYGGIVGRVASTTSTNWSGLLTVKYCLNVGLIDVSKGYSGGILGYASGTLADGTKTTIINNCYSKLFFNSSTGADRGATAIIGVAGTGVTQPNCAMIDQDNLVSGVHAYTYTDLKYWSSTNTTGAWVIREGNIPMLKHYVGTDAYVDPIAKGWTEFTLSSNGNGTINNLYQLKSFADKQNAGTLGATSASTVLLGANIVVSNGNRDNWAADKFVTRQTWTAISGFPGTFNGQGHTIAGVYGVRKSGISGVGLFTNTATTTTIQKLYIKNSYFESGDSNGTAAVVGMGAGIVWQVYADATIKDAAKTGRVAGIVGQASATLKVKSCWSLCDITTYNLYAASMVAVTGDNIVTVEYCLNTGNITMGANTAVTSTNAYLGGLVGKAGAGAGTTASPYTGAVQVNYSLNMGLVRSNHPTAVNTIGGVVAFATGLNASSVNTVHITKSYSALTYDEYNQYNNVNVVIGNDKGATVEDCECVDYDLTQGEFAYYYMTLDFYETTNTNGYWYAREGSHPIPVPFESVSGYTLIKSFSVKRPTVAPYNFYAGCTYTTASGTAVNDDSIGAGMTVRISGTNATEFENYATKLKSYGMLQYGERTTLTSAKAASGVNRFYTFVGQGENVYIAYFATLKTTRISIIPKTEETLLPLRKVIRNDATDTITATVTQMQMESAGMMYVAQLADGKYILVDGGASVASLTTDDNDRARLYKYLCDNMPSTMDKPVIACWFFTHPDPDHVSNARTFIYDYKSLVNIESFAYNFAENFVSCEGTSTDTSTYTRMDGLKTYATRYFPRAIHRQIHTGQVLSFKGLNVEILQTEEDMKRLGSSNANSTWNYTSASFRFRFTGGATCLFVGDSNPKNNDQLCDIYGSYLKSNMWQLPHHGLYGNTLELSQFVNPAVCFASSPKADLDSYHKATYDWYTYLKSSTRTWYVNDHVGTVLVNTNGTITTKAAYTIKP